VLPARLGTRPDCRGVAALSTRAGDHPTQSGPLVAIGVWRTETPSRVRRDPDCAAPREASRRRRRARAAPRGITSCAGVGRTRHGEPARCERAFRLREERERATSSDGSRRRATSGAARVQLARGNRAGAELRRRARQRADEKNAPPLLRAFAKRVRAPAKSTAAPRGFASCTGVGRARRGCRARSTGLSPESRFPARCRLPVPNGFRRRSRSNPSVYPSIPAKQR
jgi:hypothetical protein